MVTYTTNNGTEITDLEPEVLPFTDTTIVTVTPFVAFVFPRNLTENEVFRPPRTTLDARDCRSTVPRLPNDLMSTVSWFP